MSPSNRRRRLPHGTVKRATPESFPFPAPKPKMYPNRAVPNPAPFTSSTRRRLRFARRFLKGFKHWKSNRGFPKGGTRPPGAFPPAADRQSVRGAPAPPFQTSERRRDALVAFKRAENATRASRLRLGQRQGCLFHLHGGTAASLSMVAEAGDPPKTVSGAMFFLWVRTVAAPVLPSDFCPLPSALAFYNGDLGFGEAVKLINEHVIWRSGFRVCGAICQVPCFFFSNRFAFPVRRYFCIGLFGESGAVISINLSERAGSR